jgi:hypothetical protein
MREIVEIDAREVMPDLLAVSCAVGIPPDTEPSERVRILLDEAMELLRARMAPKGLHAAVSKEDFATILEGQGGNAPEHPLAEIVPHADHLALFALTLGPALDSEIRRLFGEQQFALGAMLDAAASEAAEKTGDVLMHAFSRTLPAQAPGTAVLRYSPGYCGWHVSGQKKLFAALRPEEIGIRLRDSCLMDPLKSISGVKVAGRAEIHDFVNDYDFCSECSTKSCRERIEEIR